MPAFVLFIYMRQIKRQATDSFVSHTWGIISDRLTVDRISLPGHVVVVVASVLRLKL